MFAGEKINHTENNSVLHTALRKNLQQKNYSLIQDGISIDKFVADELEKMKFFCQKLKKGKIKGSTGKPITTLPYRYRRLSFGNENDHLCFKIIPNEQP